MFQDFYHKREFSKVFILDNTQEALIYFLHKFFRLTQLFILKILPEIHTNFLREFFRVIFFWILPETDSEILTLIFLRKKSTMSSFLHLLPKDPSRISEGVSSEILAEFFFEILAGVRSGIHLINWFLAYFNDFGWIFTIITVRHFPGSSTGIFPEFLQRILQEVHYSNSLEVHANSQESLSSEWSFRSSFNKSPELSHGNPLNVASDNPTKFLRGILMEFIFWVSYQELIRIIL